MAANIAPLPTAPFERDESSPGASREAANTIEGLDEQLRAFYLEREELGGRSPDALVAIIEGLELQLHSLYEERGGSPSHLSAEHALESLEAQLCALYAEREGQDAEGAIARFGSLPALAQAAAGFEEQLAALYEERSTHRFAAAEANHMVDSFEMQVASLLDEREALCAEREATRIETQAYRAKVRSLVAVIVDRALA